LFSEEQNLSGAEAEMLRQALKVFFIGQAAIDLSREKFEEYLNTLVTKVAGESTSEADKLEALKNKMKDAVVETSTKVVQRSEVLEAQFTDKVRRQVSDFSLETLGDSSEINELRAEIASLRAEIVQLRSATRVTV
jgi:hypothetical protein